MFPKNIFSTICLILQNNAEYYYFVCVNYNALLYEFVRYNLQSMLRCAVALQSLQQLCVYYCY